MMPGMIDSKSAKNIDITPAIAPAAPAPIRQMMKVVMPPIAKRATKKPAITIPAMQLLRTIEGFNATPASALKVAWARGSSCMPAF